MPHKLFLFLEGNDDARFFYQILVPLFHQKYSQIRIVKYAQLKPSLRERLIRSTKQMGADFVYVKDLDSAPCVTACKEETIRLLNKVIAADEIAVVIKEMECWYLCGLSQNCCKKLLGKDLANTEDFTKARFVRLIPKKTPRTEFMAQILENYDIKTGKRKNRSFNYFMKKWLNSVVQETTSTRL